jgi:hypothetical protein
MQKTLGDLSCNCFSLSTKLCKMSWCSDSQPGLIHGPVKQQRFQKIVTVSDQHYTEYPEEQGRTIAQAVSRRLPTAAARVQTRVWSCAIFCDGQKWRWGRFSSPRTSVSPANLHSICFSTIIFIITRGWHNRSAVAAVPIASQTRIKKKKNLIWIRSHSSVFGASVS